MKRLLLSPVRCRYIEDDLEPEDMLRRARGRKLLEHLRYVTAWERMEALEAPAPKPASTSKPFRWRTPIGPEQMVRVREMVAGGWGYRRIGKALDMSRWTAWKAFKMAKGAAA